MKKLFIRLFDYDRYANLRIAEAVITNNSPDKAAQLLTHLLTASQVWLDRCLGRPANNVDLWSTDYPEDFDHKINELHNDWITYLDTLDDADLDANISYYSLGGDPFTTKLEDILTHVINHGTHTRAQAGQQVKLAGGETLPPTDYIYYVRNI